ncbi:hypothetical protein N0V90_012401 [Kalmusia sp. IMI 367209]|nr:hypothetical protein N0V90_012401 [Kalmusia sp. IMI 367209]
MASKDKISTEIKPGSGTLIAGTNSSSDALSHVEPPRTYSRPQRILRALQRHLWDDPDKSKEEKWFLFKLDLFLLSSSCLGYFSKNLDQANINNAYVSGHFDFDTDSPHQYLIGSWYTKAERGKRVALFYCTAALASMFSGYLQAGAYSGLDGVMGRQGWQQWLFIVCGIISLPIAFLGYFFIPDFPETTRAFYITRDEATRQCARLAEEGQKPLGHNPWNRKKIFSIAKQWQFWVLPMGYFFVQTSFPIEQPAYALWLKSTGHSVYERNVWPTGQVAIGVMVQLLAGMLSDSPLLKGRRWPAIIVMQVGTLFGSIIIAVWQVPDTLKFIAYYFTYFAAGVPGPYFAWYSDLIPHDHEMRGFVIAVSNMFSYIMRIWWTLAVWRTVDAPRFKAGFIGASVMGVAMVSLSILLLALQGRDEKRRTKEDIPADNIEALT